MDTLSNITWIPQEREHDHPQVQGVSSQTEQCAWCWQILYPNTPYPEEWSSTICREHANEILRQQKTRHKKS